MAQTHTTKQTQPAAAPWSWQKKLGFRIIFLFFLAMSIPSTASWYTNLFTLNWLRPHYRDLYDIARFQPSYTRWFSSGPNYGDVDGAPLPQEKNGDNSNHNGGRHHQQDSTANDTTRAQRRGNHRRREEANLANNDTAGQHVRHRQHKAGDSLAPVSGQDSTAKAAAAPINKTNDDNGLGMPPKRNFFADYADWGIALVFGIIGGLIWTLLDRKTKSYDLLYYWIRVVVRYRAGIGIIGFGFTKLFPTQMPYPSLGLLNSNFGDFTAQKIYWMSVGIVPWYQVFGGIVEIVAGGLLFFRRTTTPGCHITGRCAV